MALPHSTIGRHPDQFPAIPSAWNEKYDKIDANFNNVDTRLSGCETEISEAKGDKPTLAEMMNYLEQQVEGISSDMQNTVISSLLQAIDLGGLANRELVKTLSMRFQSGTITISNKGVITGCTIEKSTSATRNINLKEGTIFVGGMLVPISEETNGAAIPSNYSGLDKICYIYLGLGSRGWEAFCTDLGGSIPDNGVPLYRITVPAGSTEAVDPYLENIILTDIRRIEPNAPKTFLNAPFVYVALPFNVLGNDYSVDLDVIDFDGGGYQLGYIYTDERASNGFKVCANGMADNIEIRWTIRKLNL